MRLAFLAAVVAALLGRAEAAELTFRAFALPGEAVVLGMSETAGQAALAEAVAAVEEIAGLADPSGGVAGGLGALNAAAGFGPFPVDVRLADLLDRALSFCTWSGGVNGPLGGRLYRLWSEGGRAAVQPDPAALAAAAASAGCDRLHLDRQRGAAELAAGSALDLAGFAPGFAVDRGIEVLRRHGAANAWLRLGGIQRGIGAGPGGRGWVVAPLASIERSPPLEDLLLLDRALAVASHAEARRFLDLRTGKPAEGVLAVLAVTELAVDAQGLATTLFATGSRRGQLRLGGLSPRPSVLWVLGSGEGMPLLVDYRWSELRRRAAVEPGSIRP